MPRAGFAEDGRLLLLEGMSSDSYTSVTACVVSALVLLHSRILHKRKWKRPRVHTETAAMATFVGGGLLLIAYPLEESFAKVFLVDSLSMSLSFAVVQFVDNLQLLECVEVAGGKIKHPILRRLAYAIGAIIMFAWFPIYFLRAFLPTFFDEDPSGIFLGQIALWYYIPAFLTYNSVLELFFLYRMCRFKNVKNTQQSKIYVLAIKSLVRTMISSSGIVCQVLTERIGQEVAGSLTYMMAITVSSHVVFNTHLMDDKKLTECLFRNVVFVEEAASHLSSIASGRTSFSGAAGNHVLSTSGATIVISPCTSPMSSGHPRNSVTSPRNDVEAGQPAPAPREPEERTQSNSNSLNQMDKTAPRPFSDMFTKTAAKPAAGAGLVVTVRPRKST